MKHVLNHVWPFFILVLIGCLSEGAARDQGPPSGTIRCYQNAVLIYEREEGVMVDRGSHLLVRHADGEDYIDWTDRAELVCYRWTPSKASRRGDDSDKP